jgi:hypothetical protein
MDPSIANKNQQSKGFLGHAIQRKHNFLHLLLMGGVLLLSMKSAGQKYRMDGLQDERASLQEENESLLSKFTHLKKRIVGRRGSQRKQSCFYFEAASTHCPIRLWNQVFSSSFFFVLFFFLPSQRNNIHGIEKYLQYRLNAHTLFLHFQFCI